MHARSHGLVCTLRVTLLGRFWQIVSGSRANNILRVKSRVSFPRLFLFVAATSDLSDHVSRSGQIDRCAGWADCAKIAFPRDRKSTRLNSSHVEISYAVFCLKK